jgi:dCTP deaminase
MLLSAQSIRRRKLLDRFIERRVDYVSGMSYGLSSCGYDIRIAQTVTVWPFFVCLASAVEQFNLPNDICMRVVDKSTWARRGIFVQNTVAEPGWKGWLTLELTNHRPWPRVIRAGTPIAQVQFELLDEPTEQPYAGKYQNQAPGPQPARKEG